MTGKRPALGRGLSVLLGDADDAPIVRGERDMAIADIEPDPEQPRKFFGEGALAELTESIIRHGVLQPIVVRPGTERHVIVAGERRWRASQAAGLTRIPVIVRDLPPETVLEVALMENIQRTDLNPIEEAQAYSVLMSQYDHTQDALSGVVHKSRSHISNLLRLLTLPEQVRWMVADGRLSAGHGRALVGHEDALALAERVVEEGWSVRQLEAEMRQRKAPATPATRRSPKSTGPDGDLKMLEKQLGELLGMGVTITHAHDGAGEVRLRYNGFEQLDRLCQRLTGERI